MIIVTHTDVWRKSDFDFIRFIKQSLNEILQQCFFCVCVVTIILPQAIRFLNKW